MGTTIVTLALALAAGASGQHPAACNNPAHHHGHAQHRGGYIMPDGPGNGWGFPNGNPDGYGWWDHGIYLPLGANRTSEYYFPRYYASTPEQLFLPNYYNSYLMRGQRYVQYANCGSAFDHPMSGPPIASAMTPSRPYQETLGNGPRVSVPAFSGRVEAPAVNSGATGLTP